MRVVERIGARVGPREGDSKRVAAPAPVVIEREKTCPCLIRVFCNATHNRAEAYNAMHETPLPNELHIYTWMDATLGEVAGLVRDASEEARKHSRLAFSIVLPDRRGKYLLKKAGVVTNRKSSPDEDKTLASYGFQNGDFPDVALVN
ncbi:hypothetical protein SPRG_19954 [Saprolegnia parasitica CBS 223.65]|uniref:Histone deacetylase complex subunit SAP18 n=1 Tax=Saprolegnia parasitica (strain CBS 223.65) TaxID=695850 RepID=A0A067CPM1_SAPPC|nr:hypothetical protein SPRG_19954 [Saprolegnia parasitica CBS 223.65]KDO28737.1 hypothetical protein SPRG_19954 [Saprolegnia parasitica CBS 223.65]|eukprot:XP_012200487.1 hypothetical protein SPRG_19954 [Saprolegnia parasitica CBS 223.65]